MGTDYYWRDSPCGCCGRFDQVYVCDSMRIWRAYPHVLLNSEHPDWGYRHESPFGFQVLALPGWRRVFTERPGELRNEYGDVIIDPLGWLDGAAPWKPGPDGPKWLDRDIQMRQGWLDAGGFRFSSTVE